jgi:hypothetical protein
MTYSQKTNVVGMPDLTLITTIAPGAGRLPSVPLQAQLGEIVEGADPSLGWGKFIYLAIPASTTTTAGLLYQWDKNYTITVVPAKSSSQHTGVAVAAAMASAASNSSIQYGWFQVQGAATVLKTAVQVAPQQPVYMSATAGRIYLTASAGGQLLGARTQNTATVTATTSSVAVYLNFSALEGA